MLLFRGDVYYCNFGYLNVLGSEQRGIRPVLVIQNDTGNKFSSTVIVAPLTSQLKRNSLPTHVLLEDYNFMDRKNMVLTEQIKTIDKSRLLDYITTISTNDLNKVSDAIKVSLAI